MTKYTKKKYTVYVTVWPLHIPSTSCYSANT